MSKPPLPSSSVWDCIRIPLQFYLEWLFCVLVLAVVTSSLEKRMGSGAFVALLILAGTSTLVVITRMVRKVIALRNAKGPMRGNSLNAFWLVLGLPLVCAGIAAKLYLSRNPLKDRQEEARAALSKLVTAERRFKKDFGSYTHSMKELGYDPGEESPRYYMVGFPTSCAIKAGLSAERSQFGVYDAVIAEMRKLEIIEFFQKVRNPEDCRDLKTGFEIYAVGVIRENAKLDVWRVDENGKITNVQEGL